MTANPFTVLGLPTDPDVSDEQVRAAWRAIAAATHPDRPDGGDVQRYTAAANAYAQLRTAWGRSEAYADLAGDQPGMVWRGRRHTPARGRTRRGPAGHGRAAPGPHLARTAPPPCVPCPDHGCAVAGRGEPAAGPAVRSRRGHRPDHVVRADGARGSGPAAGPVKDDASGGVLRLGDGGTPGRAAARGRGGRPAGHLAVIPGQAEQTRPGLSRSFVQWGAPPGQARPGPHP